MLRLHVVQARYGDCLILEYGAGLIPRYLLIDGGPKDLYEDHLRGVLQGIREGGGELDLIVLSHVDDDHVHGLLDLTGDLQSQRMRGVPETIAVGELWHNTFSQTLGEDVEIRLNRVLNRAGSVRSAMPHSNKASRDIAQGDQLTRSADDLDLPINPSTRFGLERIVTVDQATQPIVLDNLTLRIVGPTQKNMQELKQAWLDWLKQQEDRVFVRDLQAAEQAARSLDSSVPNLSSIMFLAEADGKTILFTGDGRGEDLHDGLEQAGILGAQGKLHVDVLKLPHHGSKRNITRDFIQNMTADQYVASASGRHGHPSKDTLRWIVQAAHDQGRTIEIVATNSTRSLRDLEKEYDPSEYGYHLTVMPAGNPAQVLELAP